MGLHVLPLAAVISIIHDTTAMKAACQLHDRVNLAVLPVLSASSILGILGVISCQVFVRILLVYIILDTLWIWAVPDALPACPTVVLVHHVATTALVLAPLFRPELAIFACVDGLVEVNTFFLIARRQWKAQRPFLTACYWLTFAPIRLVLYPYLLYVFPRHLISIGVPNWEVVSVTVLQFMLCCFNVHVTWRSFAGWCRNRKAARLAAAAGGAVGGQPVTPAQPAALRPVDSRQYEAGMAPPTAHIAVSSSGRAWSMESDDMTAVKRSAQVAYGQHVQNAARQRKALERAQEEQNSSPFSRVVAGNSAVRVC